MIGIIDYGVGNVLAFANMYKRMNIERKIVKDSADFAGVDRLILPGVGSFDFAMSSLNESGLRESLDTMIAEGGVPVLGVCVGMQMLAHSSDEGNLPGLGWVPGIVRKMPDSHGGKPLHLPHMGWDSLSINKTSSLLTGLEDDAWFYYLHSYAFECENPEHELASCDYGDRFSCVVRRANVYGVQFHPEKSHDYGARLLRNFAEMQGC